MHFPRDLCALEKVGPVTAVPTYPPLRSTSRRERASFHPWTRSTKSWGSGVRPREPDRARPSSDPLPGPRFVGILASARRMCT